MPAKPTRGGARKGAGRKPTTGRVAVTFSVSMHPTERDELDRLRGTESRSAYIVRKLKLKPKGTK